MRTAIAALLMAASAFAADGFKPALEINLGIPLGQLRTAPASLGGENGLLLVYGIDEAIDPYHEMFFYPKGTLQFAVVSQSGRTIWKKDLPPPRATASCASSAIPLRRTRKPP